MGAFSLPHVTLTAATLVGIRDGSLLEALQDADVTHPPAEAS